MPPLAGALVPWHEFYALLGTAAGTLVGLLFVAATLAAGVFPSDRRRRCGTSCPRPSCISAVC